MKLSKTILIFALVSLLISVACVANKAAAEVQFGNQNGVVTLVEYFDYNCPICRGYFPVINDLALRNKQLLVVQKVVPALAPSSWFVDRAVLASFMQNKFSQMQNAVVSVRNKETIPPSQIIGIARSVDINIHQFKADMLGKTVNKQLKQNIKEFLTFHQNQIPIVVIYPTNNPSMKTVFIGAQPEAKLQTTINNKRKML